jgi:Uma2 family endonuclease
MICSGLQRCQSVLVWVVDDGRPRQAGQERSLGQLEVSRPLAEVGERGGDDRIPGRSDPAEAVESGMTAQEERTGAGRRPPAGKLSYEEFLAWCDEDTLAEWVNGEARMVSPASLRHQQLADFLLIIFRHWAETYDLGQVLSAPFQMHLPAPVNAGREPDVLFIATAHLDRLRRTYLDGPADLVVEIISPESIGRDRGDKFVEYEQAGVREYWLLDPDRRQAEFYQVGADGRYRLCLGGAEGTYESLVLTGLKLPLEWLWREPLPKVADALRELGLTR